jgi:hypothetical protein
MSGSEETFPPDPRLIHQTTKPGRVFCTVPSDNEKDIGKKINVSMYSGFCDSPLFLSHNAAAGLIY